jgi:hypothetical protein
MRAFEIHTYTDGKWKIDSVFDDRELAIFEAQRIDDSNRYAGVRVVEEVFDESTQKTATKTIFRGGRVEQDAKRAPPQQRSQQRAAAPRGSSGGTRKGGARRPPKKSKSNGALAAMLAVILVGGIVAMVALHFLPQFV